MKYDLGNGYTMSTKDRAPEFKQAIEYLLKTFPPKRYLKFLSVTFYKGEGLNIAAVADYAGCQGFSHLDCQIRVAYGKNGKCPDALNRLFHEYKHLLQDDEGYLYAPQHENTKYCCIEAQAWADEQEPLYQKIREAKNGLVLSTSQIYLTTSQTALADVHS